MDDGLPILPPGDAVVAPFGNNMTHTAGRINHVAPIPRNDVDVKVEHGLAGRLTDVDSDVVPVGRMQFFDNVPNDRDAADKVDLFLSTCVEPRRHMPIWNQ